MKGFDMRRILRTLAMLTGVTAVATALWNIITGAFVALLDHLANYQEIKDLQNRLKEMEQEEFPKLTEASRDKYNLRVMEIMFELEDRQK